MLRRSTHAAADGAASDAICKLIMAFPLAGLSIAGRSITVTASQHPKMWESTEKEIFYNPEYLAGPGFQYRVFDLLHEWFHIFGNHLGRRGGREDGRWGWAIDCAVINAAQDALDQDPPADGIQPPSWTRGLSAEVIYERAEASEVRPHRGCCAATPMGEKESEEFRTNFRDDLIQAQMFVEQLKLPLTDSVRERLIAVIRGALPWGRILRGTIQADLGVQYETWSPPRRKYLPHYVLPSIRSLKERCLVILVDVSGSMTPELMSKVAANIAPAAARATKVVIVCFDAVVREVVVTRDTRNVLSRIKFKTGAHSNTDSREAFAVAMRENPSALVCITDGIITLPEVPLPKTLFVLPEGFPAMPWGKTIFMEASW